MKDGPRGPGWGGCGGHHKTPQHIEAWHRHSAAQRPLTHLEINYACFHITIQPPPPLWETLTPSTPCALVFLHPPPHPPTRCRPHQGNRQVTVTQSRLLQLHENLPGCRLQYLWYSCHAFELKNSYSCHQLSFNTTFFFRSHICNHMCNAGAGAGTVFPLAFPAWWQRCAHHSLLCPQSLCCHWILIGPLKNHPHRKHSANKTHKVSSGSIQRVNGA